jgi:hypothetical protein
LGSRNIYPHFSKHGIHKFYKILIPTGIAYSIGWIIFDGKIKKTSSPMAEKILTEERR